MNKSFHFSYPVLSSGFNSGYKSDYSFTVTSIDNVIVNNSFEVNIQVELFSDTIKELIINNKASVYVKVYADIYKKAFKATLDEVKVKIPINELLNNDTITIVAYILANDKFDLMWNDEMEYVYSIVDSYYVNKNDILAISNLIKFNYYNSSDSIIKFSKDDTLENKGFRVRIEEPNYINIRVSPELNIAYSILRNSNEKKYIVNSTFAFIAISSTLVQLANHMELGDFFRFESFSWFKVLKNSLQLLEKDLNEVLEQYIDNKEINIIYDVTHMFLNNNFERAFVEASKGEQS